MSEGSLILTSIAVFVLGVCLMVPFEHPVTMAAGIICLLAFIPWDYLLFCRRAGSRLGCFKRNFAGRDFSYRLARRFRVTQDESLAIF